MFSDIIQRTEATFSGRFGEEKRAAEETQSFVVQRHHGALHLVIITSPSSFEAQSLVVRLVRFKFFRVLGAWTHTTKIKSQK